MEQSEVKKIIDNIENPKLPKLTLIEKASQRLAMRLLFMSCILTIAMIAISLKPRKKAPAKVFKRGIEGFMLLRIKRLVVDDFDGVVVFYLQNGKTITVDLCNVLFVKGGVFVADADYDRQA